MDIQPPKPVFDSLPPKTAFIIGFVSAVLTLGTIGFVALGSCVLKDGCSFGSSAVAAVPTPSPTPSAPTPAPEPVGNPAAVTDADHIRGDKKAKITLIEYSDFQCPFCGRFAPTADQILKDYAGKVKMVYRHFPLSFHPNAEPAAEASECADEQGKFWEFHDKMFQNQEGLTADYFKKVAADLGLNATKFQACLDSDKMLAKVRAQQQEGGTAGVTGTPGSFLVDDKGRIQSIRGALPFESIKPMIDQMLQQN
ncbi:DsbA family protein [Candidatus Uhrbacteria bacterium]|nr:DsbA family protein [Candidatus Uhrbacteria bacterium]